MYEPHLPAQPWLSSKLTKSNYLIKPHRTSFQPQCCSRGRHRKYHHSRLWQSPVPQQAVIMYLKTPARKGSRLFPQAFSAMPLSAFLLYAPDNSRLCNLSGSSSFHPQKCMSCYLLSAFHKRTSPRCPPVIHTTHSHSCHTSCR